jgi:hypothetical protein
VDGAHVTPVRLEGDDRATGLDLGEGEPNQAGDRRGRRLAALYLVEQVDVPRHRVVLQ